MLIVGLGNPGQQYSNNRHNVGFLILDTIFPDAQYKKKFCGLFAEAYIGDEKVKLLKPMTYMNNSGVSVAQCSNFYKIKSDDILVIHDDLDLAIGRVKLKAGGSSGGNNGLKSIDSNINKEYRRLRFGISRPERGESANYVLADFSKNQRNIVNYACEIIEQNKELLLQKDDDAFMNKYALEMNNLIKSEE